MMKREIENPAPMGRRRARKLVNIVNANNAKISLYHCNIQVFRASPRNCASSTRTIDSSNIVRLNRWFRPRIEVEHRQAVPTGDWIFTLHYVDKKGRLFVGNFEDAEAAFNVARVFRDQGVRIVCVDGVQP